MDVHAMEHLQIKLRAIVLRGSDNLLREMAGAAGFEPATYGFGDRRSTN